MNMLANLSTDASIATEKDSIGGSRTLDSGLYGCTVSMAYINKSAAGAIYETAGRKSGITGNFTPRLGGQLVGKGQKMTGRAIFRAFEDDRGKAQDGVVKAIFKAKAKFDSMKDKV